tara:strand:+ start:14292 stop:14654 length:363 start_codon:yes stop_codon:yes gene_type:complete
MKLIPILLLACMSCVSSPNTYQVNEAAATAAAVPYASLEEFQADWAGIRDEAFYGDEWVVVELSIMDAAIAYNSTEMLRAVNWDRIERAALEGIRRAPSHQAERLARLERFTIAMERFAS